MRPGGSEGVFKGRKVSVVQNKLGLAVYSTITGLWLTVLCCTPDISKGVELKCSQYTHSHTRRCEVLRMLITLIGVNVSQCMYVSNHRVVHLKYVKL